MKDKKVIFMGTPSFAVPILEALIENTNVVAVVTQPDKEVGREKTLSFSEIKKVALENNIKVYQPIKIKDDYAFIRSINPDVIVTCAYGQFLPEGLINIPKYHTINVHASLLPKLRGGAPIHHAIINGDKKTGITIMRTDKGMDSGDIIKEESIDIGDDTYDLLSKRLALLGTELLIKTLPSIFDETAIYTKQDESLATKGFVITKEDEHINFDKPYKEVINHIRGLSSTPGAYALLDNERIKIYNAISTNNKSKDVGVIKDISKDGILVSTSDYDILLTDILLPGKKRGFIKDLINGLNKEKYLNKKFY